MIPPLKLFLDETLLVIQIVNHGLKAYCSLATGKEECENCSDPALVINTWMELLLYSQSNFLICPPQTRHTVCTMQLTDYSQRRRTSSLSTTLVLLIRFCQKSVTLLLSPAGSCTIQNKHESTHNCIQNQVPGGTMGQRSPSWACHTLCKQHGSLIFGKLLCEPLKQFHPCALVYT